MAIYLCFKYSFFDLFCNVNKNSNYILAKDKEKNYKMLFMPLKNQHDNPKETITHDKLHTWTVYFSIYQPYCTQSVYMALCMNIERMSSPDSGYDGFSSWNIYVGCCTLFRAGVARNNTFIWASMYLEAIKCTNTNPFSACSLTPAYTQLNHPFFSTHSTDSKPQASNNHNSHWNCLQLQPFRYTTFL